MASGPLEFHNLPWRAAHGLTTIGGKRAYGAATRGLTTTGARTDSSAAGDGRTGAKAGIQVVASGTALGTLRLVLEYLVRRHARTISKS